MKKVLIVGAPRSGSTWVSYVLGQHPDVVGWHQATFQSYLAGVDLWRRDRRWSHLSGQPEDSSVETLADALPLGEFRSELAAFADHVYGAVAASKPGASVVVDKQPENCRIARRIHAVDPDVYFLHVIRDPRSVFVSQRAASQGWANFEFPTRPCDGADLWLSDVRRARTIASFSDRYLEVRYEDMHADGERVLAQIHDFVGIDSTALQRAEAIAAHTTDKMRQAAALPDGFVREASTAGWVNSLTADEVAVIEHVAGPAMDDLGYARTRRGGRPPPAVRRHRLAERLVSIADRGASAMRWRAHRALIGRTPDWVPDITEPDER